MIREPTREELELAAEALREKQIAQGIPVPENFEHQIEQARAALEGARQGSGGVQLHELGPADGSR